MSDIHECNTNSALTGWLHAFDPRQAANLAIDLCACVESGFGASGFHGAIWPGNASLSGENTFIGPTMPLEELRGTRDPNLLEFSAPERFWNGELGPAGDVYAIGLILYAALNRGEMPFCEGKTPTPDVRAAAMKKRMRGAPIACPRRASRELGNVVLKAIAFRREDRYASPVELRKALQALPESAFVAAAVPVIPLTEDQIANNCNYRVDKQVESTGRRTRRPAGVVNYSASSDPDAYLESDKLEPDRDYDYSYKKPRRRRRRSTPVLISLFIMAALVLASLFVLRSYIYTPNENVQLSYAPTEQVEKNEQAESQEHTQTLSTRISTTQVAAHNKRAVADTANTQAKSQSKPQYEVYIDDVSWEEACTRCKALGGHLATVSSDAELEALCEALEPYDVQYAWLGASRSADGHWLYVTGKSMNYAKWADGEPSSVDTDGTEENCLILCKRDGVWTYNDVRSDVATALPGSFSGKLCYVCQFD